MPDRPYSVAVAGAVVNDGRLLLVRRRDGGWWEPPGGVLESGETIYDGVRREVWEETGLTVAPGPITGIYQNVRDDVVAITFRCRPIGGQLTANAEATDFLWAAPADVPSLTTEVFAARLLDGLANDGPRYRWHDGVRLLGGADLPDWATR